MCSSTYDTIDRDEILAAARWHPFVRLATAGTSKVWGFIRDRRVGQAMIWCHHRHGQPRWYGWGDPAQVVQLLRQLRAAGELAEVQRCNLPQTDPALLADLAVGEPAHWDYLWTRTAPPVLPKQHRLIPLTAEQTDEVRALMRRAFPDAYTRPGDPDVRRWYGIREQDRLVACGADVSRGVGYIAGLAVDPQFRGRGLGAALTSAMAARVLAEFGVASLGVMVDNHRAARLYRRLGFTQVAGRTSVRLSPLR